LYLDNMTNTPAEKALYGPFDDYHESGGDIEYTPAGDGTAVVAIASFQADPVDYLFRVVAANQPPVLDSIPNQTVDEGTTVTLTAHAVDVDGDNDRLTYSLDPGAVASASINPVTGAFSWTTTEADGPGVYFFTVRVVDDGIPSFSDTNSFTITVREVNQAPTLGPIANRTLNPGQRLSITNTFSDPDLPPNPLTFTLIGAPTGMTISPAGVIDWRPSATQAGTSNLVQLRLDDHGTPNLSVSRSFSVVVNPLADVRLTPVFVAADHFVFTLTGSVGPDYDIQVSPDLMPTNWSSLFLLTPTAMPVTVTNSFAPDSFNQQFYRAVVRP
ncbi:MAG: Ig-like domain-containing protein, partial [Verrucomicrobia bacterium]|nr:Ig-like domain-containing protein [Verrucomicrobiota bacterium]